MSQTTRTLLRLACLVAAAGAAQAQMTEVVLHKFNGADGATPAAGVIRDSAGNLYGTTGRGGASNLGVVYKLDTSGKQTVLYSFCSQTNCTDGSLPTAGVIQDSAGDLCGTTEIGGAHDLGVVYKLDTSGNETVLYSFCSQANCTDGFDPQAGVIRDSAGDLYGTTLRGGASDDGVVYKLDASGNETVLYSFCLQASCTDGQYPDAGVVRDSAGNLYGTTYDGGAHRGGVVYKLDTSGNETVLYSFCSRAHCTDGNEPSAGVIQDSAGNLYGTTVFGGASNKGVVYKLDAPGKETVLYSFCSRTNCADGEEPLVGVILDSAGNLYGTAYGGASGRGVVYKLDTSGNEAVLYSFCSQANCADGSTPAAGVIRDSAGNLYGTTAGGGKDRGVVFKLKH